MNTVNGIFFKDIQSSYIADILKELYIDKIYDNFTAGRTDMTIVDIGANIGLFSLYAYPFAKRILSVEPCKESFDILNHMLKHNKMDDKVTTVNVAISHEEGVKKLFSDPKNSTANTLSNALGKLNLGLEEDVRCVNMETLFKENNINDVDLLKLDIEGLECDVVGSQSFENIASKIKVIVGEYHKWSGVNPNLLITTLNDYGFDTNWLMSTEATVFVGVRK